MKRLLATACTGLALVAGSLQAQTPFVCEKNRAGAPEFYSTNYGIFGLNVASNSAGFTYPRGSGHTNYIFGSGLWFGARKSRIHELSKSVFITYNPNSGASWAMPGEYGPNGVAIAYYNSLDYDRSSGAYTGTRLPATAAAWPMWLTPGTITQPMYPGSYVVNEKERKAGGLFSGPAFMPGVSEQIVTRFNDGNLSRYENIGADSSFPLGLQIQQTIYTWANGPLSNSVVLQYEVINRSMDTLTDCAIGQMTDADIGSGTNDHARFYSEMPQLRTGYVWSDREATQSGALAITLVEAPVANSMGLLDNTKRYSYLLNGRMGTFANMVIEQDPVTSANRYDVMTSGVLATDNGPGDCRVMPASSKFSMRPGDTAHFTIAFTILSSVPEMGKAGRAGGSELATATNAGELQETITRLMHAYYVAGFDAPASVVAGRTPDHTSAAVYPNPAHQRTTIAFGSTLPTTGTLSVINNLGAVVQTIPAVAVEAGSNQIPMDVSELANGRYTVVLATPTETRTANLIVVHQ